MLPERGGATVIDGDRKRAYVRQMFTDIAPRYDLLNHLLSLNIDRGWRRKAIDLLLEGLVPGGRCLDLCAGTMDLAFELAGRESYAGTVFAADFVVPMLRLGRRKGDLAAVGADALELPFGAESFDGVTVGFGVRNLASLESGLREIRRVLKFGGRVVILEFAKPRLLPLRAAYMFYFRRVLPGVGRLISRHKDAYNYLPDSVLSFPEPHGLERMMSDCGFDLVGHRLLTGGIAALHWGVKA